jgi:putative hemolysin
MTIAIELAVILLLVLVNAVFAGSEIAVVSARKSRLQQRADAGDDRYRRALELANDPNRFLSTIQIGITLIGVFAGAFAGATIARQLTAFFGGIDALARYAPILGLGIVVAGITFLSLVVGELVPKRLALAHPEGISAAIAKPMHMLSRIASPLVSLLGAATDLVLRLLPQRAVADATVTSDDIRVLLEQGTRAGVFLAAEQDIVENVFWLGDQRVNSVMTPRHRIVWLDVNDSPEQHSVTMLRDPQARYILCDGGLDKVVGVASMKDIWPRTMSGEALDVTKGSFTPLFVPESTHALTVLEQFRKTGVHVALVMGENTAVRGLVTLTDILEGLVGELVELEEDDVVQRQDGSWLVSASVRLSDVRDLLGLPEQAEVEAHADAPDGAEPAVATIGELVTRKLGRPVVAGRFEWQGYMVEVVDMDGHHVDKVLIAKAD